MTNEQKLKSSLVILKPTFMSDGKPKSRLNIGVFISSRVMITNEISLYSSDGSPNISVPMILKDPDGKYSNMSPILSLKDCKVYKYPTDSDPLGTSRIRVVILKKPIELYINDVMPISMYSGTIDKGFECNIMESNENPDFTYTFSRINTTVKSIVSDRADVDSYHSVSKNTYKNPVFSTTDELCGLITASSSSSYGFVIFDKNIRSWLSGIVDSNKASGIYNHRGKDFYYNDDVRVISKYDPIDFDGKRYITDDNGVLTEYTYDDDIDAMLLEEDPNLIPTPDVSVEYETRTQDLETLTQFDLPDVKLEVEELKPKPQEEQSVSGSYSKESDKFSVIDTYHVIPPKEPQNLYERLSPTKTFVDYLDKPVGHGVLEDFYNKLTAIDHRYGIMLDSVKTQKDLLQFMVNFRWRRFNLLDHYVPFTDYAQLSTGVLNNVKMPSDFPVLITGNTVMNKKNKFNKSLPFSVDYTSNAIVYTEGAGKATMNAELGVAYSNSINTLNMSCYWYDADWLITNQDTSLKFTSVNDVIKLFKFKYRIMAVTGVEYFDEYMTVYIISNYTEHALTFDKEFNLVEDFMTEIFPPEIVKLLDPKNVIFRDKYQYYVNNDDGSIMTFPLRDMFTIDNVLVKKYSIHQTTLKDPRPIPIVKDGPRINTKYGEQYCMMWSFNESVSLLTLYPAMGYEFDKYSFYNPRKYLTQADYDEACIPLHKGFRRTQIYPWFWGRPGFTWVNGFYYGYGDYYGRYFSFWNMYWWFYW